jgi:hypothetical protein
VKRRDLERHLREHGAGRDRDERQARQMGEGRAPFARPAPQRDRAGNGASRLRPAGHPAAGERALSGILGCTPDEAHHLFRGRGISALNPQPSEEKARRRGLDFLLRV